MLSKRHTFFVFAGTVAFMLLSSSDLQAQCAMCKAAAESSMKSDSNSIARGLNSGILYLMAVPYILIAFLFRKQIVQLWKSRFKKTSTTSSPVE